jgi:hypothetical protein
VLVSDSVLVDGTELLDDMDLELAEPVGLVIVERIMVELEMVELDMVELVMVELVMVELVVQELAGTDLVVKGKNERRWISEAGFAWESVTAEASGLLRGLIINKRFMGT